MKNSTNYLEVKNSLKIIRFEYYILIVIFVIALIKSLLFSRFGFGLLDEGESLNNATRILSGKLPYQDFYAIFPPGDNYYYAFILEFINNSVIAPRIVSSIIFSFIPVVSYLLFRKNSSMFVSIVFSTLLIFIDVNIERLFFFLPILLSTYIFLYVERLGIWKYIISGLLIGIVSLFRFDIPGTYLAGMFAVFLYDSYGSKMITMSNVIKMIAFIFSYLAPILALFIWLSNAGIWDGFVRSTTEYSIVVSKLHSLPFPKPWELIPSQISLSDLNASFTAYFAYLMLSAYFVTTYFIAAKRLGKSEMRYSLLFVVAGILSLVYVFGRSDLGHIIKGGLPFIFLSVIILELLMKSKFRHVAWLIYIPVFVYFISINLWWIKFNDTAIKINGNILRVNSRRIEGSTALTADSYLMINQFVESNSTSGDRVLFVPYMAGMYYLNDRQSPTVFNNILNGFTQSEYGEEYIMDSLSEADVNIVVYDQDAGPRMERSLLHQYNPKLHKYVMDKYEVVEITPDGVKLMKLKTYDDSVHKTTSN